MAAGTGTSLGREVLSTSAPVEHADRHGHDAIIDRTAVSSPGDRLMLGDRVYCDRCDAPMAMRDAAGRRWYVCQCPRRILGDDLDGIVLGLAYDRRRQLGDRELLTLDDEPAMIARLVARVRVGVDWSEPTVEWIDDPR